MIELLLAADRLLAAGDLDHAERIYRQVIGADPRNAIAEVGLARVAEARGAHEEAVALAQRALDIDPEDLVARRLVGSRPAPGGAGAAAAAPEPTLTPALEPPPAGGPAEPPDARRPGLLARLRAFLGLAR